MTAPALNENISNVRIREINPNSLTVRELAGTPGFLAVSVGNPNYTPERLEQLLLWTSGLFSNAAIVVGDHLQRHNLSGPNAEQKALDLGRPIISTIQEIIRAKSLANCTIVRSKELFESPEFLTLYAEIRDYFENDSGFKHQILRDASAYVSRRKIRVTDYVFDVEVAMRRSINYIIEELAYFALLVRRGFATQAYYGRNLTVLKRLSNGELHSPVPELNQQVCVDVS